MTFNFFKKNTHEGNVFDDKFYEIFQKYYNALKEIYHKKGESFEQACKLELALYLLFRADFMLQSSPNQNLRRTFFEENLKKIQGEVSNDLLDLCYLRLEIYGIIYNDFEDKKIGVFSEEFLNFSYDWLISAIELCNDDYKLMAQKRHIPLSLNMISNYPIKVCLQELDIKYTKEFIENMRNVAKLCRES